MLIKELTLINGSSGDEKEIRETIKEKITHFVDRMQVDSIGNLYAIKDGASDSKKVMIATHMDEFALMVTSITDSGMLKFKPVGASNDMALASKRVVIGQRKVPGIIGIKPVHLADEGEKKRNIEIKNLFIDIGCSKKEEAEKIIELGDYVYFISDYVEMGNEIIKTKALDDRVGCAALIEILKEEYNCTIQGCFTAQEEIGTRGAGIAAFNLKPDMAIVIEGTTCSDVPDVEGHRIVTRLGKGPAISIIDASSIANKGLFNLFMDTAKKKNIEIQIKEGIYGGNDAGKIQTSIEGIPTIVISVPCRYIHSPNSIMSLKDFRDTIKLVESVLSEIR